MIDPATSLATATYGYSGMNTSWPAAAFHGTVQAISKSIAAAVPTEVPSQQEIELKMKEWEFELGFGF